MFCHRRLGTSVDELVHEFEDGWDPKMGCYSTKLVEFCCSKALTDVCSKLEEALVDGSFSRITFDMMLAWQMPSSDDEERHSVSPMTLVFITTLILCIVYFNSFCSCYVLILTVCCYPFHA